MKKDKKRFFCRSLLELDIEIFLSICIITLNRRSSVVADLDTYPEILGGSPRTLAGVMMFCQRAMDVDRNRCRYLSA